MNRPKFKQDHIMEILHSVDDGKSIDEVCELHHISIGTYYKWKAKYSNRTIDEVQRMDQLEHENRRLKKLYDQSTIHRDILRKALEGKL